VHHVGILYDQFMMHGQRNIKKKNILLVIITFISLHSHSNCTSLFPRTCF